MNLFKERGVPTACKSDKKGACGKQIKEQGLPTAIKGERKSKVYDLISITITSRNTHRITSAS